MSRGARERTVVLIDGQNAYRGARDAFFARSDHHTRGQFRPRALASLLAERSGNARRLVDVRIYTGQPSASKDRRSYAASRRQHASWQDDGVTVVARPLRYPPGFPNVRPQEKGVDVQLAIDFVALAHDDEYDVGIIFSSDTDLIPALEFVMKRYVDKTVEIGAWRGRARLVARVGKRSAFCHFLRESDYWSVADGWDYNRKR